MPRSSALLRCLLVASAAASATLFAQERQLPLATPAGLTLHQVEAAAVTFQGRAALKLTASPAAASAQPAPAQPSAPKKKSGAGAGEAARRDHLALVDGLEFTDGTIEVDLAGEPSAGAAGGARGFVGVAFRVQPDRKTYDCFYLRPTNGRSDDQERRNHTAQYISHPEHTWFALREKTPSRYESYVDIQPATWIHVKIVVAGDKARLFVNHLEQPTLIVNDVKTGATGKGSVALWFEGTTIAHYANLKIQPAR
jgi:hypothetical protein